jgi:hypothetical protein
MSTTLEPTTETPAETPAEEPRRLTAHEAAALIANIEAWIWEHPEELDEGALPPDVEAILDASEATLTEKAERIGRWVLELEHEVAAIKEAAKREAARLARRSEVRQNKAERLRAYLERCLRTAGKTKVETPLVTAAIAKNPAKVVGEVSEETLWEWLGSGNAAPELRALVRHEETLALDKKAALALYKAEEKLSKDAARLFPPELHVVREEVLRIK